MKRQAPHHTDVKLPDMSTKSQKNARKKVGLDESWRDGSVAQRNLHMLNSESMADCTFVVGAVKKKKFQCHKYVLCNGSPVFYAMFNGGLQERGEVKVDDIEPQHFRKMLEFIYSDNTELENVETTLSVCYAANKYMINTLTLKCIAFINRENLDSDTVCRALEFARLIDHADLEAECLQYLHANTSDILKSASFPNVEKTTLLTILNQDRLFIASELELFSACIRWAEAQQRGSRVTLREVLGPNVLNLIRFLTMTVHEFATVVIPSKLLQLQQEQGILYRLVTGTGNISQGLNTNTESRVLFGPREIIKIEGCDEYDDYFDFFSKSSLSLSVNVDSYIFGLQLCGVCGPHRRYISGNLPVQDSFEVKLLLTSELVASAKFEGELSPDAAIEVDFSKPVLLKADTKYALEVTHNNTNAHHSKTSYGRKIYTTTDGVEMTVKFSSTTISHIFIAKKFN